MRLRIGIGRFPAGLYGWSILFLKLLYLCCRMEAGAAAVPPFEW